MAITLGTEVALSLHMDRGRSYGDLEAALVDAGFITYNITRTVNFDGSSDVQLYVRSELNAEGGLDDLPAAETMQMLTEAIESLAASEPAEEQA